MTAMDMNTRAGADTPRRVSVLERASDRAVRIDVDLAAVRANIVEARRLSGGAKLFAVIKADAYGHGAVAVARALSRADMPAVARADGFAVVTSGEAMALRDSGIEQPILVLQGPRDPGDAERFVAGRLWPVIHDLEQHRWYRAHACRDALAAWLKVDTGMGRLGVTPVEAAALLRAGDGIRWHGVLSHLACADEPGNAHTEEQIRVFGALDPPSLLQRSLANSAAIIGWPAASRHDWVRPGLMLYGCDPRVTANATANATAHDRTPLALRPAMRVSSSLLSVKTMAAGAGIGYAQTWRCPERMSIGLARVGYADGLPRVLDARAMVSVRGVDCAIVGRVSMDSIALDLRGVPQATIGDEVELWGGRLAVDAMASAAGTIAYELLTSIRGERRHIDVAAGDPAACDPAAATRPPAYYLPIRRPPTGDEAIIDGRLFGMADFSAMSARQCSPDRCGRVACAPPFRASAVPARCAGVISAPDTGACRVCLPTPWRRPGHPSAP